MMFATSAEAQNLWDVGDAQAVEVLREGPQVVVASRLELAEDLVDGDVRARPVAEVGDVSLLDERSDFERVGA